MLTLKQIEEIIKLNRDTKSIKYVDENKNPIEPTEKSIVEDIEYTEYFNGGPFGGYSEHNYIITIKNENSLKNQSFIKYLLNKINSKLTIVSKLLLLMFICSLLIPIPNGTTTDADVMTKLLVIYLSLVSTLSIALILLLVDTYFNFISDEPSESNKFKNLVIIIIVAPIISYAIYLIFNIITPLQLVSLLPSLALLIMYVLEFGLFGTEYSKIYKILDFNFKKIKRILFKK